MKKSLFVPSLVTVLCLTATGWAAEVTNNLAYNFDGDAQTPTAWTASSPGNNATFTWTTTGSVALGASGSTLTHITTAYNFTGGSANGGWAFDSLAPDATFEIWVKPADLTSGKQVLFETGGGANGFALTLWNDTVWLSLKHNSSDGLPPDVTIHSQALTTSDIGDYIQIVGTVDGTSSSLYVNPVHVSDPSVPVTTGAGSLWAGGDPAGLAGINGTLAAGSTDSRIEWFSGSFTPFHGQIGLVRIYDNVLTGSQVADNFNAIVNIPEPATLSLLAVGGVMMLSRRNRR